MSFVLERLLREDFIDWERIVSNYEMENKNLPVPAENSPGTLHRFNVAISDLYQRAHYDFSRARRNKDAIERFIENVLKDYYKGPNEDARRGAGIQFARQYPAPDCWHQDTVDLFEIEDRFRYYYYSLQSTIRILEFKAEGKITNNSLLKLERDLTAS